jgi:hypothetical protein
MTEKQEARLIKKVNRIKQKIKELESINKENELKGLAYMNCPNNNEIENLNVENEKYIKQLHDFHHPVGGIYSEPFTEKDTYMNIIYVGLSILLLIHIHVPDNW